MVLKKILIFTICLIVTSSIVGQKKESEFERLKGLTTKAEQKDSAEVFKYGELAIKEARKNNSLLFEAEIIKIYGDYFYHTSQYEKAIQYYDEAEKKAKHTDNTSLLTSIDLRRYLILVEKGDPNAGKKGFLEIIERAKKNNDTVNIIEGLNNLANSEEKENKRENALKHYLEALEYATNSKSTYRIAFLFNNIGLLKWKNGQNDEALTDFKKGLEMAEEIDDERLAGHLYNNIGLIYNAKKDFIKANEYFFKFLSYSKKNNLSKEMGVSYLNIGHSFFRQKKNEIALAYYDSTISLFENNNVYYFLPKSYLGKALVLNEIKEYHNAKTNVDKGMAIATEYNILDDIALGHKVYSEIAENQFQFEVALKEYTTYKELNDSIAELNNKKKVAELQIQYDVEKKENELIKEKNRTELLEKEKELEKIKLRTYIIYSIIGIVILAVFFFIRHFTILKRKQEEFSQNLIESIDIERERIAKDLHDDLGQRLSVIKNKVHLSNNSSLKGDNMLEDEIGNVIEQTRDIARELYPSYLAKIGLDRSIAQLLKSVQESTQLICSYNELKELDSFLSLEEKTHFYRIIQEAINNTIKHSEAKALKISIKKTKNGLILIYRDNGKGLKDKKEGKGIGFMSMLERVKMLNGTMIVSANSGKGIKLVFEIHPKKNKK